MAVLVEFEGKRPRIAGGAIVAPAVARGADDYLHLIKRYAGQYRILTE